MIGLNRFIRTLRNDAISIFFAVKDDLFNSVMDACEYLFTLQNPASSTAVQPEDVFAWRMETRPTWFKVALFDP